MRVTDVVTDVVTADPAHAHIKEGPGFAIQAYTWSTTIHPQTLLPVIIWWALRAQAVQLHKQMPDPIHTTHPGTTSPHHTPGLVGTTSPHHTPGQVVNTSPHHTPKRALGPVHFNSCPSHNGASAS